MDVNVRDIDEIVRFAKAFQSFVSDYLGELQMVNQGAQVDRTKAENTVRRIRSRVDSAESDLRTAQRRLEDAIDTAERYPEEDHSYDIEYAEQEVDERQEAYDRAQAALEEAEQIYSEVKQTADRVYEEIYRSRNRIGADGQATLQSIQKAARAIAEYAKK